MPLPERGAAGGRYKVEELDFEVEELSIFDPDGRRGHLFLWIEKRGLSTPALVAHLAEALDIPPNDIGYAGMKDARALTRQWVSVPDRAEPRLGAVERAKVLRVEANGSKLRTGELAGNRFRLLLRGAERDAIEDWLMRTGGAFPNYFGRQRFGDALDTHQRGLSLLRGNGRPARGRTLRLALSAAQSALFNALLAHRVDKGSWNRPIAGDVVLRESGRAFHGDASAADEAILHGRASAAGPIFGPHMRPAAAEARRLEEQVLAAAGLRETDFGRFAKLTAGTRRSLRCWLKEPELESTSEGPRLSFTLPPGSYATMALEALGVHSP